MRIDRVIPAHGEGLHPLQRISGLRRDQNPAVGGCRRIKEEGWQLISIQQVPAIQVVLRVEGVVDPADELFIERFRRNGVLHHPAVVDVHARIDRRQVFFQRKRLRVPRGNGGVLVAR